MDVISYSKIAQQSVFVSIKSTPQLKLMTITKRIRENANEFTELFRCKAKVGYQYAK